MCEIRKFDGLKIKNEIGVGDAIIVIIPCLSRLVSLVIEVSRSLKKNKPNVKYTYVNDYKP